ncbi:MAG TPA: HEAT repeat domain-containing protein [Polyangia bacterium]
MSTPTSRSSVAGRALAARTARYLGLAVLVLLSVPACKRKPQATKVAEPAPPPVPALGEVTVSDLTPESARPQGARLDVAALTEEARRRLAGASLFSPGAADAGAQVRARVRIELSLENVAVAEKAAARAGVRLRIDTRPSEVSATHWHEDVQAGAETIYQLASKPDPRELFQKLSSRTIADLLDGYIARQRLWTGDGSAARTMVKADAGELRLEAMRAVGERRLTGAADDLLSLLEDPDESVRDAALGALVNLKERRAVSVLTSGRSMRDAREMRKILDAIAVLGGPEAAEYLGFVADGHDDAEIRAIAAEARGRMLRRADARAP